MSSFLDRIRDAYSETRASRRRTTVVLTTVIALFIATVATAFAYWLNSGTGTGSATSNTLNAPTNVTGVQTPGTGTVAVSWTAPTGTVTPTGYYVVRNNGVTDSAACGTTATSPTASTSCNDLLVPIGSYSYRVIAIYRTWTSTSLPSLSVTVQQSAQSITFTSSPVSPVYQGTYTVSATGGGSGNPVTFSSGTPSVCTVSGSLVTFVGVGTCTVNANQTGSTYYAAAPTTPQTFSVGKASQTITFPTVSPGTVFGSGSLGATASSGLAVTYTSTTTSVCTVSGSTISYLASGTCTIKADQAGNSLFNAAPQVSQDIAVGKASQTITAFTAPSSGIFGGSGSLSGTASSGLTVTFSSNTPSVCTVSGSTVNYVGTGTCTVQADQAGDATHYSAAPPVTKSFTVNPANQTITWTGPSSGLVGQSATLSATASSGLTVTFSSTTPSVCTVSGTTVNYIAAGTCTLEADQAGNSNYNAAPQLSDSFTVSKQSQTITFGALGGKVFGDAPFTVSATASSGLAVTFTSATTSVCTVSGNTVTIIAAGGCTINADQAGNGTYNAAPQVQQSFTVAKANQTISFTSTPTNPSKVGTTYTVAATSTSGLTVTFGTSTPGVCTSSGTNGSTITFITVGGGTGACIVTANQAGNTNYNAATQATQNINVAKGDQTITFAAIPGHTFGDAPFTVPASASSGLAVTLTSSTTPVCTVSGSTITIVAAGTCTITATQPGDANWNAATPVPQSFTVAKANQTISFTTTAPSSAVTGTTYNVAATSTSGLTVAITVSGACTISSGTVTFGPSTGTCTINANQAGDTNYNPASQQQQTVTVTGKLNQTISFPTTKTSAVAGSTYTPAPTATSGLAVTTTVGGACSIASGVVTFGPSAGTCTISANQPGNATYNAAPQVQQIVTVSAAPTISNYSPNPLPKNTGGGGNGTQNITLTGTGFQSGVTVTVTGSGFTVNSTTFNSSTSITISLTYSNGNGNSGTLTVHNPDGGTASIAVSN